MYAHACRIGYSVCVCVCMSVCVRPLNGGAMGASASMSVTLMGPALCVCVCPAYVCVCILTGGAMGGNASMSVTLMGPGITGHVVFAHKSSVCAHDMRTHTHRHTGRSQLGTWQHVCGGYMNGGGP